MALTYALISSSTLSASASSVTFSSIPATFTDLVIRMSVKSDAAATYSNMRMVINATTANYADQYIRGDSLAMTAATAATTYNSFITAVNGTVTSTFSNNEIYIPSYAAAYNKTFHAVTQTEVNSNSTVYMSFYGSNWFNTAAITSLQLTADVNNFVSGSSFYLYGIKNL